MRLNIMNIPVHKNCTNCGKCCGIIPATTEEVAEIRKYIAKNSIKPISNHKSTCPFRDEVKKKCLIYPADRWFVGFTALRRAIWNARTETATT